MLQSAIDDKIGVLDEKELYEALLGIVRAPSRVIEGLIEQTNEVEPRDMSSLQKKYMIAVLTKVVGKINSEIQRIVMEA